jgi:hypothetical protein
LWNEGEAGAKSLATAGGRMGLFFLLASLSLAFLLLLLWLLFFLLEPRMATLGTGLIEAGRLIFAIAGLGAVVVVASDFLSARAAVRLLPGTIGQLFVLHVLLPVSERLGRLVHLCPDEVKAAFIDFNNALLRTKMGPGAPSKVLLLLPHCLQSSDCSRVLGEDVRNCGECGNCAMCELKGLVPKYDVQNRIVGGGALALMAVRELRPRAVVGVACERELVAAIKELRGIPVMAIPNCRPEGPCRNTKVDVTRVEEALQILLKRSGSHCTIH